VTNTIALDAGTSELLRQAQDWRLLGLLFERPRDDWWQEIAELAATTRDESLRDAAAATLGMGQGAYLALLGPGGVLSAREAGYRRTSDPGQVLFEIQTAYEAFAYKPAAEDPPDHIAVECGFVGWLCLKQAYALASGDHEAAEIAGDAAAKFQKRHLAAMAEPMRVRFELVESGYLLLAAKALLARVGERPKDLEGYWAPDGLAGSDCASACGAAWADEGEPGADVPPELPLDVAQALES
jgi:Nitrate reductase delta subunit